MLKTHGTSMVRPRYQWAIAVIVAFVLTSCGVSVETLTCDLEPSQAETKETKAIASAVHIDGSGSMLGYVDPQVPNSQYVQTIELLYDTFSLIPAQRGMPETQFYRSDKPNNSIAASQFRKAKTPEFYDGTNPAFKSVTSALDQSIVRQNTGQANEADQANEAENDQLLVFVTDLNMNEGDNTRLLKKIQSTYFGRQYPGHAVGVLGVQSEFAGQVYPVDSGSPFSYEGDRPFYILMMGPYSEVQFYLEKLKSNGAEFLKDSQVSVFYPNAVVQTLAHLGTPQEGWETKGISQPNSLNDGNVALEEDNPQNSEIFELSGSNEPKKVAYKVPFASLPFALTVNPESLDFQYQVEYFDPIEKKFNDRSDEASLKNAIEFENISFTPNNKELSFTAVMNPQVLAEEPGIYTFKIGAIAQDYLEADWWKDWNLDNSSQTDGAKTRGLRGFMRNMKNLTASMAQDNDPALGKFCFGIQKN